MKKILIFSAILAVIFISGFFLYQNYKSPIIENAPSECSNRGYSCKSFCEKGEEILVYQCNEEISKCCDAPSTVIYPEPENNEERKQELLEIMNEIIQEKLQEGINISVKEVSVINREKEIEGSIVLGCEEIGFEKDEAIIKSISEKLILKYPDEFSQASEGRSRIEVTGCSETGSSPDGINEYFSRTQWLIVNDIYDYAI